MKVVFMGTPDFAVGTLHALVEGGHTVAAVVTQPDKPKGRGMDMAFSPVKEYALSHGIPVLQPTKVKGNEEFEETLRQIAPDVCVVVAYGKILPLSILQIPPLGCVNVHASLLPKYRGSAPIQWCIVAGDKVSGVTTMQMDEGMDTGDILDVLETPISDDMTGGELHDVLADLGARLINVTLRKLEAGKATPVKQDEDKATYVTMLSKADGKLDFTKTARQVADRIRGFDPWPTAFCTIEGKTYKLFSPKVGGETKAAPGTLVSASAEGISFACGDGRLLTVGTIQAPGSRRMTAGEYLNGHTLPVGAVAETE